MGHDWVGIIVTIVQSAVLVFVIAKATRLMHVKTVLPFFFVLAMACYLLSDLYWLAYDLLNPDTRMPIAANEIAECAMILLLSASLKTALKDATLVPAEIAFAVLYTGVNIVLWIVWSGEWFQDIFFGIPYIYFLWILIRGIRSRGALRWQELAFVAGAALFVTSMLVLLQFVEGDAHTVAKALNYAVSYVLMAYLAFKSIRGRDFFVASTFFLWTVLCMFSSAGIYYHIANIVNTLALPVMLISIREAADGVR